MLRSNCCSVVSNDLNTNSEFTHVSNNGVSYINRGPTSSHSEYAFIHPDIFWPALFQHVPPTQPIPSRIICTSPRQHQKWSLPRRAPKRAQEIPAPRWATTRLQFRRGPHLSLLRTLSPAWRDVLPLRRRGRQAQGQTQQTPGPRRGFHHLRQPTSALRGWHGPAGFGGILECSPSRHELSQMQAPVLVMSECFVMLGRSWSFSHIRFQDFYRISLIRSIYSSASSCSSILICTKRFFRPTQMKEQNGRLVLLLKLQIFQRPRYILNGFLDLP